MIKLLCIEDQPDIQTLLKLTLEASGRFDVSQAETGADGVADAARLQPDAILLDFSLPDMNGLAVLDVLKKQSATADIPVIFLTAMTATAEIDACKARGAVDVLIKPFNPRTLAQQIEGVLRTYAPTS